MVTIFELFDLVMESFSNSFFPFSDFIIFFIRLPNKFSCIWIQIIKQGSLSPNKKINFNEK